MKLNLSPRAAHLLKVYIRSTSPKRYEYGKSLWKGPLAWMKSAIDPYEDPVLMYEDKKSSDVHSRVYVYADRFTISTWDPKSPDHTYVDQRVVR